MNLQLPRPPIDTIMNLSTKFFLFQLCFRMERDLMTRTDRFGIEVRERVMWDIRQGVVGSDTFIPKHVVMITWKNMSFAGGIDNSLFRVSFESLKQIKLDYRGRLELNVN